MELKWTHFEGPCLEGCEKGGFPLGYVLYISGVKDKASRTMANVLRGRFTFFVDT